MEVTKLDWANVMNDFIIAYNRVTGMDHPQIDFTRLDEFEIPSEEYLQRFDDILGTNISKMFKEEVQLEANHRQGVQQ